MRRVIVRYKLKEGRTEENEALVRAVFAELAETRPDGFSYTTWRMPDGLTHFHIACVDGENPLASSKAFQTFQAGIKERCDEPPQPTDFEAVLGSYGPPLR